MKMKAAPHQYLLAYACQISAAIGASVAIALMFHGLLATGTAMADVGVWLWILLAAIPAGLIGSNLGSFFNGVVLYHVALWIQGWPFKVGEEVVILTGKHKNTVARIYDIWHERGQVRVELGPGMNTSCEDVFFAVQVCRIKKEPDNQAMHDTADSRAHASATDP